jgi:TolA-binding protein
MRSVLVAASCGLALLLSAPVMASETQSATDQARMESASQQLICRAPVHESQLLLRAKQCYTKAEWDARLSRMQNSIRELQTRALTVNNGI